MPKLDGIPGLNTADEDYEIGLAGLTVANNIDHLRGGKAKRRPGRTQVYSGTPVAAAGGQSYFLFTEGDALKRLESDYTATTLVSGLLDSSELYACRTPEGKIYWSTQQDSGVLVEGVNRSWNIPRPQIPGTSSALVGTLNDARYLFALAFLKDGNEGPMSHAGVYEGDTGIDFTLLDSADTLSDVDQVRLYLSTPNGKELYQAGDFDIAVAPSYVGDCTELGVPADLEGFLPMPVGGSIRYFAGRLWLKLDSSLVYSEEYHSMPRPTNFIGFGERVEDFGVVSDGLFVGTTDHVYFLGGTNPRELVADGKADYGMIPGSLTMVDGRLLGEGIDDRIPVWASPRGICAGLPGGRLVNLTERKIDSLAGEKGTSMFRQYDGQNHFITVLQS